MIAIVKAKAVRKGGWYSSIIEYDIKNINLIWVYKSLDEFITKGTKSKSNRLITNGYKLMRGGKDADQYVIDMSFKEDEIKKKDMIYLVIEKEIKPLIRDWQLKEILEN